MTVAGIPQIPQIDVIACVGDAHLRRAVMGGGGQQRQVGADAGEPAFQLAGFNDRVLAVRWGVGLYLQQQGAIEMGGAADLDSSALAVGVDAIGKGRAGIQGQMLLDPGGTLPRINLEGSRHPHMSDASAAAISRAVVDPGCPENTALVDQMSLDQHFGTRTEVVLAGECPGALFDLQPFEVSAVTEATAQGVIEDHQIVVGLERCVRVDAQLNVFLVIVSGPAIDPTDKAAAVFHDQGIASAAQVEGVTVAAVDQPVVGHLVDLFADKAHAKALLAANGAVVFQDGGPLRRIIVAVTHLDAMIRAADGAFGVLEDRAASYGDTFAGMGAAILINTQAAFADNLADVVNLRIPDDPYAIAVGIQGACITRDAAVVGDLAGARGIESRAVEPTHVAAVREFSLASGVDAVTPAREGADIEQGDSGGPQVYAVMTFTADFPVVDDASRNASDDLDGASGDCLNVAVTMIGVVD